MQGCANGCSTHRWWRAGELLRRPIGIDAARRAASIGGTQNRQPGSLTRRSGASTRNRLRDSLRVLGGPTGPILGRVCKGVQGCARVCKGCSSTAWPAPSSLSSAKCAQSDSASIGHITGLTGYAALDLFEWASAQSPGSWEPGTRFPRTRRLGGRCYPKRPCGSSMRHGRQR